MPPRPPAIWKFIFHPRRVWVNGTPAPAFNYHHAFAFKVTDADPSARRWTGLPTDGRSLLRPPAPPSSDVGAIDVVLANPEPQVFLAGGAYVTTRFVAMYAPLWIDR